MDHDIFLTAEWRKLIMMQYGVSPEVLVPYLPPGVELDLYQGMCFVSMVGFLFERVRVKGVAIPFHTRFEEINLRFYVRRIEPDGSVRRGVVFIREFVPRAAITLVANKLYEEPYATLPTRHRLREEGASVEVQYEWKHRRRWYSLGVEATREPQPILKDSLEGFITEHYWGYTKRSRGGTSQYEVRHPGWEMYPIRRHTTEIDFGALYGEPFAALTGREPDHVLLAEGSAVSVHDGTRLANG